MTNQELENLNSILTRDFNQMLQRNAVLQRERDEAHAEIARMQRRIETVEGECSRHAEATKRAHAELRQAHAKIARLWTKAYE